MQKETLLICCLRHTGQFKDLEPVPERPISANPWLKLCSVFVFYLSMHCLE